MDRSASAAFLTELLKSRSEPCHLLEFVFDDGTIRLTDAWKSITWNGNTYNANGHFLGFSGLRETFDMQIPTVGISLSAVDQSWIAVALTKEYIDRPVRIYKGFIDYVNGVVSDPLLIFDGCMDAMPIQDDPDGGTCTIAVSATNQWADFERRTGRHTNNNEQQALFPGDLFFERAGQSNRQIKWGAA